LKILEERGALIIQPGTGLLASGASGIGRMAEPEELLAWIRIELGRHYGDLRGRRVLVTAGGTQEPIDPVRYIGNRSSGQMGYALAQQALDRGAQVVLVSGPVSLKPPIGSEFISVETAMQMQSAVRRILFNHANPVDVLIMAAAVADFRPSLTYDHKVKKGENTPIIELTLNPDILGGLTDGPGLDNLLRVGFAAETNDLRSNAEKKLEAKKLDMIVANEAVSSIGKADNQITMLEKDGRATELPRMPKEEVAMAIIDKVVELLATRLQ
jgi:phosphopantothenoylcysteine decarboxylase/phosphopantothenate--cysteine ligase